MNKNRNRKYTTALSLVAFMMFQGCLQQDTTGDTTQLDMNRQNSAADAIEAQYSQMKGQYSGKYNNSDVLLTLDVARQTSTGNGDLSLVPQPTLIGNLNLTPEIFVSSEGQPMTIPFGISSGQYASGNDLTLTVLENGNPTTLHCKVANLNELDCNWYVHAGTAPVASFSLSRISQGQALRSASRSFGGTYTGSNSDYHLIKAQFRTVLEPQAGSNAIPQISIAGSFSFNGVSFNFKDSAYDPISNTLAININGDNPIVVNCLIKTAASLHCTWIGTHGETSYEEFDLASTP